MPVRQLVLFLVFSCLALAASAQGLEPFSATYSASYNGIKVEARRELSGAGDNWRLDFRADSFLADIREHSRFSLADASITPRHYEYRRTGLGRNRHTSLNFENGRVVNVSKPDRTLENVPKDIHDKISYQLQLALDVAAGKEDLVYQVADGKRVRTYRFAVAGTEKLQTPLGPVDTVKVERVREEGADRTTYIWFAPEWNHALVKLMQEEDGETYQISLTKFSTHRDSSRQQ
ncbi:DUF3108 domain-containing protein [Microbulbifer sp. M83]|uniref:DUF3108 domain-containing protein n=1 Tax=Microbulbifer sp. M83 TaxID=3118246 RepID=UPI002FE04C59